MELTDSFQPKREPFDTADLEYGVETAATKSDPLAPYPLLRRHIEMTALHLGHRLQESGVGDEACRDAWRTAERLATESALAMMHAILVSIWPVESLVPKEQEPGSDCDVPF